MIQVFKHKGIIINKYPEGIKGVEFMSDHGDYQEIIRPEDPRAREALTAYHNYKWGV